MSGLIFMLIGLVFIFLNNALIGFVSVIISLIISIVNLKRKSVITWITFIGSIILILYYIFAFIVSFNTIGSLISKSKINTYKHYEDILEFEAEKYLIEQNKNDSSESLKITIKELEANGMEESDLGCSGYVIYEPIDDSYNAYIKCDGYETAK